MGQTQGALGKRRPNPGPAFPADGERPLRTLLSFVGNIRIVTDLNDRQDVTGLLSSHSTTSVEGCLIGVTRRGT